jgi:hypothetical protein
MEVIEPGISTNSYDPWRGHPTPESPVGLGYSPSNVLSGGQLNVYVDHNKLHHPSMKSWTPASSTDLSEDNPCIDMMSTSVQVLERIKPVESDSFGSAEEMWKIRDEQTSAREYSLRQTYSFLNEISSLGVQDTSPNWSYRRKDNYVVKAARKIFPPTHDTWNLPSAEATTTYETSPIRNAPTRDARQTSLNKNKLAAAKCRINKNIQTDKLRESAHTVIAANNRLRQEVMDKMEEIQALHTEVLCHAVDRGCHDPHELRQFLCSDGGRDTVRSDPALAEEPHSPTTMIPTTLNARNRQQAKGRTSRRRSDAPSPSCGINRFKHGSLAHHRAERKLRTQLSEP